MVEYRPRDGTAISSATYAFIANAVACLVVADQPAQGLSTRQILKNQEADCAA
ncbi:MAG: hypothetical protein ACOX5R_12310 [bacterium]